VRAKHWPDRKQIKTNAADYSGALSPSRRQIRSAPSRPRSRRAGLARFSTGKIHHRAAVHHPGEIECIPIGQPDAAV
jgi:hypothetical protein